MTMYKWICWYIDEENETHEVQSKHAFALVLQAELDYAKWLEHGRELPKGAIIDEVGVFPVNMC